MMIIKRGNKVYEYMSSTPSITWARKMKRLEEKSGGKMIIRQVDLSKGREFRMFILKKKR